MNDLNGHYIDSGAVATDLCMEKQAPGIHLVTTYYNMVDARLYMLRLPLCIGLIVPRAAAAPYHVI
jgi:hypothetical protein